jgi:hypothetical protein
MPGRRYVVRWVSGKWGIFRNGDPKPVELHDRKLDAVSVAASLAAEDDSPLLVQDPDEEPPGAMSSRR